MKWEYLAKLKLPDTSGVYIFRDYKRRPLYIGRATSLRDRTRSYFSNDLIQNRGPRIVDMITKAHSLTSQKTDSVLEAVLLESSLIKRYQPFYNVDERDDKSDQYVVITDELWPRVFLVRARDLEKSKVNNSIPYKIRNSFGPFTDSLLIKEALRILRKMFPFRDKKAYDPRHEAFYQALGRSPEKDSDDARQTYLKTIKYLVMFFDGNKKKLRKDIERDMRNAIKDLRFEEAGRLKKLLFTLDHIKDITLIKNNSDFSKLKDKSNKPEFRIEAYDIAHLSGYNVVGVMVVSMNGESKNSEYRRFKVSKEKNNDIAGLKEILERRLNHSEWSFPDIMVVDGGVNQFNVANDVLKTRRMGIPVIAVTKDDKHKATKLIGNPDLIANHKSEIISINAEAHRFAITYHKLRRTKSFGAKIL